MASGLCNSLTWSHSRLRAWETCRRRYFYTHYASWEGWMATAAPEKRDAYRLKQMKSAASFAGELVHEAIRDALRRLQNTGEIWTPDTSLSVARKRWELAWRQSSGTSWRQQPKQFACFHEDYYADPRRDDKKEAAWECIETSLVNFYDGRTWRQLCASRPERWLAIDADHFQTALVEGIPMYGRPDLGYAFGGGSSGPRCRVFDWKTGSRRDADVHQLHFYALFASGAWGFRCEDIAARLIYLADGQEEDITLSPRTLEEARAQMKTSFAAMQAALSDIAANTPLPMAHFPVAPHGKWCPACSFQEICTDRNGQQFKA